ncbi:MAG: phospholipid/cholesterol/gamma-HCH transport system substrate-binding protein [Mycobacterium sp.]|jgi:virulence factor Mce-like protein|nr:phospholipid/cholesterol/gamma-HCH transport system substrate-binding protein [Mycobacterium sp.]
MTRKRLLTGAAIVLVALVAAAAIFVVRQVFYKPKTITAYFTTATAVYQGDEVRVSGVKVGSVDKIEPVGTRAKMTLHVDRDAPIPDNAKAVIVAQNLVAARYVQLTPAYRGSGAQMKDGAVIPCDPSPGECRTATPVEWDQVKQQLMKLSTELGPNSKVSTPAIARFIDSAANALDGNGDKLRQTLTELSGLGRTLTSGDGNVGDIIQNLQAFVTALRDSNLQLVQFNNRLATLTSVLDDNRSDLDAALSDLSVAVGELQRFVHGSRDQTSEQIRSLASVTQTLVDHQMDLKNILHIAPTSFANFYNIYNPDTGSQVGAPVLNPLLQNPVWFYCGMFGAIENATGPETAKLCEQYLGPALRLLNANNFPLPINPFLMPAFSPGRVIYSEPRLAPGGEGPRPVPPEQPPSISAYTGLPGDYPDAPTPPPPPARIPGVANPAPTSFQGPPPPPPPPAPGPSLPDTLLPAEAPPS